MQLQPRDLESSRFAGPQTRQLRLRFPTDERRFPGDLPQTAAAAPDGLLTSIPHGRRLSPALRGRSNQSDRRAPPLATRLHAPQPPGLARPGEGPRGGAQARVRPSRTPRVLAPPPILLSQPPANEGAHRAVGRDGAMPRLANRRRRSLRGDAPKGARAMLRGVGGDVGMGAGGLLPGWGQGSPGMRSGAGAGVGVGSPQQPRLLRPPWTEVCSLGDAWGDPLPQVGTFPFIPLALIARL